jgi:NAD+ synthase (glutamine-hydrolysing)
MKISLVQINTCVADFEGNTKKVLDAIRTMKSKGIDLVVFPELVLTGYPPRDLLDQKSFIDDNLHSLEIVQKETLGIAAIIGFVYREQDSSAKKNLYNAAAFLSDGQCQAIYSKQLLPDYDVFDELRHFSAGRHVGIVKYKDRTIGLSICEDIWNDKEQIQESLYADNPIERLVEAGAELIVNISASPFQIGKVVVRHEMLSAVAKRHKRPVFFCNLVGGNDQLVFDGHSMVFNATGRLVGLAASFEEDTLITDLGEIEQSAEITLKADDPADIMKALASGVRDYVRKSGFSQVVLGLSGGVDSALTAAIAVTALGPDNVEGVLMSSPYTSEQSIDDAEQLAKNLGIKTLHLPISAVLTSYLEALNQSLGDQEAGVTEENLQARIRGNYLMALSNKHGSMVLSTGNKSEIAVGYCTLYGDMCGGLAVISDLSKTMVYEVAQWINRDQELIPQSILDREPSAELRENQRDQDTLPPYDVLDKILKGYIEEHLSQEDLVKQGHDEKIVSFVVSRVINNEYKRQQMPIGLKVSSKAFGIGRRYPIARKK